MPRRYNSTLTPEQRKAKARRARAAQNHPDALVRKLRERRDELTDEHRATLAMLAASAPDRP